MYKVYLSPSVEDGKIGVGDYGLESYRMNEIANEIEKQLINMGQYIVFRNKENMSREEVIEESNKIKPDIHIGVQSNSKDHNGPECFVKVGSEVSNGFAKEIYKNLNDIYYDKSIDNGIKYDEKILEINKVDSPAVLVKVGSCKNNTDANWIIKNINKVGESICKGIDNGFKLRPC